jgi:hypothetical protein
MLSAAIEMLGGGQLVEKTVSFDGDLRSYGVLFGLAHGQAFDFVRLAPHFAQEDRYHLVNKISVRPLARASTVRYWLLYGWMLEAHSARIPAV